MRVEKHIVTLIFLLLMACGSESDFLGRSQLPDLPESLPSDEKDPDVEPEKKPVDPGTSDLLPDHEEPNPPDEQEPVEPSLPVSRYFYWDWECEKNTFSEKGRISPIEVPRDGQEFKIDLQDQERAKVSLYGVTCPYNQDPVDVVIAVDVSDSMHDKDPRRNLKCGRLSALESVVKAFAGNAQARFALVTFNETSKYVSTSYANAADFLKSNGNSWRTVCQGDDEAYFEVGLNDVYKLVKDGREGIAKEVYLITDGAVEKGHEGLSEFEKIKDYADGNAFVGALQLGDSATFNLANAVTPNRGMSQFHKKVANAGDLTVGATDLATPKFSNVNITLKDPYYLKWQSFEIQNLQAGNIFQFDYDKIDRVKFPTGLTVFFEYANDRGRKFQYFSSIFWQ